MPESQPPYLKLHVEEASPAPTLEDFSGLDGMLDHLTKATGWSFQYQPAKPSDADAGWRPSDAGRLVVGSAAAGPVVASSDDAEKVAASLNELLLEFERTRHAIWQREAELAAGVPVVPRPDEDAHLAARLESSLRNGANAIGCEAAALYLLDDATTMLKMRSAWGLPKERLVAPPRQLRGEMADLEALMGHAVAIEDTHSPLPWKCPEDSFRSALCVPISTPSTPLGTLWLFGYDPRPFSDSETGIAEIIAGSIASLLEREVMLAQSAAASSLMRQVDQAGEWFEQRLPHISPLTTQWQFAGARLDDAPGGEFYDWAVLPDGRIGCAVADCAGYSVNSLLNAAAFRAAFQSHQSHRHSTGGLLRRINETLWTSSPGDLQASLFYSLLDEDTGAMEYAWAGEPLAIALRDSRYRTLATPATPLGVDPETMIESRKRRVEPDEILILLNEAARHVPLTRGGQLNESLLARVVRPWRNLDALGLADRLSEWLSNNVASASVTKTCLLVAKRAASE